ncbi:MAG: helix-turn-helix domain-containing protein, partial [Blastocatellia bacterium]
EASLRTQPVNIDPEKGIDFYENVARFEIQLIESALEMTGGRQNKAARLLNMRTSTLCTKMKQLNIKLT